MRNKRNISFLVFAAVLLMLFCQGCGAKSTVSRADLKAVNRYIGEQGAGKIHRWDAEYFGEHVWENKETQEIKTTWELIVNFVENAASEEPQDLGYTIEFERAGLGIADNKVWTRIGG